MLRPIVAKISETSLPVLPSDAMAPPDSAAWLPAIVELVMLTVAAPAEPSLKMPPPSVDATLPSIRLLKTVSWPWLAMPAPLLACPSVTREKIIDSDAPAPTEMLPPSPLAGRPPWTVSSGDRPSPRR